MNQELFELCASVYKFTGWKTGRHIWSPKRPLVCKGDDFMDGMSFPLYTSDYLLEKLPVHVDKERAKHLYQYVETFYPYTKREYMVGYEKSEFSEYADTPLKALLKLVVTLHESGKLENGPKRDVPTE